MSAVVRLAEAVSVGGPSEIGGVAMAETPLPVDRNAPDAESLGWVEALSADGPRKDEAIARLHELLLRAARFEVARRGRASGVGRPMELDDLAMQAAADALMAVLRKLPTYRGDSRFTTWAYKFALLEAAVRVRRRAWHGREVPLEDAGWSQLADRRAAPDTDVETAEVIDAIRRAIGESLTPHQREVLIALTLNDVPIDVLADRLSTTRGALYKTLHDGRKKLRARLAQDGHRIGSPRHGETG